uniref:Polymerase basic protein 2 n=1 Tax=Anthurium amnicola TaxID=1678845 RepID=A0A1D1Z042_9ARAE
MASSEPSSAASTPRRSDHHLPPPRHRWHHLLHHHDGGGAEDEPAGPRVRLMCSFGGRILPRPHDHQLRYAGGETRIAAVPRSASFAALLDKLAKLSGAPSADGLQVKYQLPHEGMDALISLTSDEDVDIMMDEYDRLQATRTPHLRLFLFPPGAGVGDDPAWSSRWERWFLDSLNSGGAALERGRSEASSVVSESPDYLFGLDSGNSDEREARPSDPDVPASDLTQSPVHNDRAEPPMSGSILSAQTNPVDKPVQQVPVAGYSESPPWQQYTTEPVHFYYIPVSVSQQQAGPVPVPLHISYGSQPSYQQHVTQGFNPNHTHTNSVYVGGMPMVQAGPLGPYGVPVSIPECYSLPTVVEGAHYGVSGHDFDSLG